MDAFFFLERAFLDGHIVGVYVLLHLLWPHHWFAGVVYWRVFLLSGLLLEDI